MSSHLLLIDGLNLIRRIYAAPGGEDSPEKIESAVTSSASSLKRALSGVEPTHALCVFDGEEEPWRRQIYPAYKAGRTPMPEILRENLPLFRHAFLEIGIRSFCREDSEADDVIATIAMKAASKSTLVTILSNDKAFLQLLSKNIRVRDHFHDREITQAAVIERFGVDSGQLIDFWALAGDSTNNIKGIPSIGPKKAKDLINRHHTLPEILEAAAQMHNKTGWLISEHSEDALLSKRLVTLKTDIELGINMKDLRIDRRISREIQGTHIG